MYLRGLAAPRRGRVRAVRDFERRRPGPVRCHNVKDWTDGEWLGLVWRARHPGRGAVAQRGGDSRLRRPCPSTARRPGRETRRLSSDDAFREALIMGLRLSGGVDVAAMRSRYGQDAWTRFGSALALSGDAGLVTFRDGRLKLTRQGTPLSNEVLAVFV